MSCCRSHNVLLLPLVFSLFVTPLPARGAGPLPFVPVPVNAVIQAELVMERAPVPGILTGRWTGACTEKRYREEDAGEGVVEERRGGQLNLEIVHAGTHCVLKGWSMGTALTAEGTFLASTLSAAQADPPFWFWRGTYNETNDALRGILYGHAEGVLVERAFFLRRLTGKEGG